MAILATASYGQLYHHGDAAAYAITGSDAKFTGIDTAGVSHDVTVSATNKKITVVTAGTYMVSFSGAFYSAGSAMGISYTLYKNGVSSQIRSGAYVPAAAQLVCVMCTELMDLVVGDYLELYIVGSGVTTVTTSNPRLSIVRVA